MSIDSERVGRVLHNTAKTVTVLSGFYVGILCLQPKDGGPNLGVAGIGGSSAVIVAIYLIVSAYTIYRKSEEIDELKAEVEYHRHK